MPFLIYKRHFSGGFIHYERRELLKLGGADGPVARFVKTLQGDAVDEGWELEPLALLQLAGHALNGDDLAMLFEVSTGLPGTVCLYRLHRLCGVARDRRTHLSLDFEVLVDRAVNLSLDDFKRAFFLPADQAGKRLHEILQLSGGTGGGDWKWEASAMNLGATLVGPPTRIQGLIRLLRTRPYRRLVSELPGYDGRHTGDMANV